MITVRAIFAGSARRTGATLLEVVVIMAILGLVMALAIPAVLRVRDAAARANCSSNMRQLAVGVQLYANDNRQLPQGCSYPLLKVPFDLFRQPGISWHTSILPYVEQDELWRMAWQAHVSSPSGTGEVHADVRSRTIPVYLCPSEGRQTGGAWPGNVWGLTSYQGVAGTGVRRNDGVFHRGLTIRFSDITDGTSTTLMIGERPPGPHGFFGAWYSDWGQTICQLSAILPAGEVSSWSVAGCGRITPGPLRPGRADNPCDLVHFWSWHLNGANFAFADGSVRFLPNSASRALPALATRAGGEVVSAADY